MHVKHLWRVVWRDGACEGMCGRVGMAGGGCVAVIGSTVLRGGLAFLRLSLFLCQFVRCKVWKWAFGRAFHKLQRFH